MSIPRYMAFKSMTSPASLGLTDVHDSCRLFAGLRANRAAGWHNGCETQHAIADLLACRSEGDSNSEAKSQQDAMGFGASSPADGQRQKARAAPGRPVAQSKVGLRTDVPELHGPELACATAVLRCDPGLACATAALRCANFPVLRASEQQIAQFFASSPAHHNKTPVHSVIAFCSPKPIVQNGKICAR